MADSQQPPARLEISFDVQRALLRIDRFYSAVDALIKATEAELGADSAEAYFKAYAAFLDGCRTIEAVAYDLEDIGFAGAIAPNPAEMEKSPYRYGLLNKIFQDGKLVGGTAVLLVEWLRKLKDEIAKARDYCCNVQHQIAAAKESNDKKPALTEPLAKKELAKYFNCHRNDVKAKVLDKYPHETVGKGHGERYRMHVANMPPVYLQKQAKPNLVFTGTPKP